MTQLRLQAGDWEALILPEQGAAFDALRWCGRDILVPTPVGARHPGAYGAFWMLPWANRLDGGRIAGHAMPINRPAENTAIHGLARDLPWHVQSAAPDRAVLHQYVSFAPFQYSARLTLLLDAAGLLMEMELRHEGAAPVPYGMGWHPWFARSAETSLHLNATQRATHDARGLPHSFTPCAGIAADEAGLIEAAPADPEPARRHLRGLPRDHRVDRARSGLPHRLHRLGCLRLPCRPRL
jgi:aldose 1-epimerase